MATYGTYNRTTRKYKVIQPVVASIAPIVTQLGGGHSGPFNLNVGDIIYGHPVQQQSVFGINTVVRFVIKSTEFEIRGGFQDITNDKPTSPNLKNMKHSDTGINNIIAAEQPVHFKTIGGYAGIAYGLYFAHKRNSSFGGYVGWALVWSIAFSGVGSIVDYTVETFKK